MVGKQARSVPTMRQVGPALLIAACFAAFGIVGFTEGLIRSDLVLIIAGAVGGGGGLYLLVGGLRAWQRLRNTGA